MGCRQSCLSRTSSYGCQGLQQRSWLSCNVPAHRAVYKKGDCNIHSSLLRGALLLLCQMCYDWAPQHMHEHTSSLIVAAWPNSMLACCFLSMSCVSMCPLSPGNMAWSIRGLLDFNMAFARFPDALPPTPGAYPPNPPGAVFTLLREGDAFLDEEHNLLLAVERIAQCAEQPLVSRGSSCVCLAGARGKARPSAVGAEVLLRHLSLAEHVAVAELRSDNAHFHTLYCMLRAFCRQVPVYSYSVPNFYGFRGENPGEEASRRADYSGYTAGIKCLQLRVVTGVMASPGTLDARVQLQGLDEQQRLVLGGDQVRCACRAAVLLHG